MPSITEMQRALARKAVSQPEHRFNDLYGLVKDTEWLRAGLEAILSNEGAKTAGIDGTTKENLESERSRALLVERIAQELRKGTYQPQPVRRVYIPKSNGKQRPLGIPTIADRMVQECLRMVLEPIYESLFLPCSFGFRPVRCTMDAIRRIDNLGNAGHRYYWIVEGDIKGCFDNIPHKQLLAILGQTVADHKVIQLIQRMLAAGYVEQGKVHTPNCGTPQGGVVSPLLANIYLHEMDKAWQQKYNSWSEKERAKIRKSGNGLVQLIRYADDFLLLTNGTRDQAQAIKEEFQQILENLGLELAVDKTMITHLNDGFDFLGFHIQREQVPQYQGRKRNVYIRPTEKNIERLKQKVTKMLSTHNQDVVNKIRALNAVLRGWANYYRYVASHDARSSLDNWVSGQFMGWLHRKHGGRLTNEELYTRYRSRDHKDWKNWGYAGMYLAVISRDIKWKPFLQRTLPHPYLDSSLSLAIQDGQPIREEVWDGTSSQNRYAIARLERLKEVNYTCQGCQKGPLPITELHAHHPRGKSGQYVHEFTVLCTDCHKLTPTYGVRLDYQNTGEPDDAKVSSPVRRRGRTHTR